MKKILIIGSLALLCSSFTAVAADKAEGATDAPGSQRGKMVEKMDSDKSGSVSKDEYLEFYTNEFNDVDTNGDGSMTEEEVSAHHKKMKEKMQARQDEHFNKMDTNGDGNISKEEMQSFREQRKN
jgi:hypothetical protein